MGADNSIKLSDCCGYKLVGHFESENSRIENMICTKCGKIEKRIDVPKEIKYRNCTKGEFNDIQSWGRPNK